MTTNDDLLRRDCGSIEDIIITLATCEREAQRQRDRVESERRQAEARTRHAANRLELESIRHYASMTLGLSVDCLNVDLNSDGAFSVSYRRDGAASTGAELRELLANLASVLAPPPPPVPENDPDDDDDNNWRVVHA